MTASISTSPTPIPRALGATHIEMSSTDSALLPFIALTCPTGSLSSVAMTFSGTSRTRERQRSSVASIHSESPDPKAAGASANALRRSERHSRQLSTLNALVVTPISRLFHLRPLLVTGIGPVVVIARWEPRAAERSLIEKDRHIRIGALDDQNAPLGSAWPGISGHSMRAGVGRVRWLVGWDDALRYRAERASSHCVASERGRH